MPFFYLNICFLLLVIKLDYYVNLGYNNKYLINNKFIYMAKRETGLKPHTKSPRSHKTAKRLVAKNAMLAKKTDKKKSVNKKAK